ncbi:ABC transporter substrate-binding protein [Neoroseomonas oryzicola]|uniref:ABC transporter substrate-binding protein n=1 Tax=Neoroseomonas oryzicola TaxID=535904 RepID=A0A9X9WDJ2_9PROT|nr:NrtA/SsuA/CpmA family ABC transporter substrate-binding protein [Neoroseomonas oryzicola]MBR0658402.1 ABC transporter substrate-binding protein [Neoroseomonas oryzicola]NKE17591.1 ABC transporter substrate-binding protein [Neoroseomonas oryzicola]
MIRRRHLLAAAALAPAAAPHIANAQAARTVKVGSLRLIHSMTPHFYQRFAPAGLTIEIITFDSPTDGKNAVVTRSVDVGGFGIAAATLGAAAGEPVVVVGAFCNKGMAIVAKKGSGITDIAGLRGKRVGIWPGSTQEVFILERLRMTGMSVRDIQSIRVPFGEMHAMLSRGDIDAYVGAEPGPGLSISSGVGELVEYPYGTAMGGLNMIMGTSEALIAQDPALVKTMLGIHRRASEYMMANKAEVAEATVRILGAPRAAVDQALGANNVEYTWKLDDTVLTQARTYAEHMQSLRQIRQLPDFAKFLNPRFSNEIATS